MNNHVIFINQFLKETKYKTDYIKNDINNYSLKELLVHETQKNLSIEKKLATLIKKNISQRNTYDTKQYTSIIRLLAHSNDLELLKVFYENTYIGKQNSCFEAVLYEAYENNNYGI